MQIEVCPEVSEFLSFLKIGTRNVYSRGLAAFQQFYSSQGSIKDFLDCVEQDRLLPRSEEVGDLIAFMDKPIYRSMVASIAQSGLSVSDLLGVTYGNIRDDLEKGIAPICIALTRKKTGIFFITFLGSWSVKLLKDYLANRKMDDEAPIYNVSARAVHAYFRKAAQKLVGCFRGRNPYSPHSLRAAFRTFLSDHTVDPLYIKFWMGHKTPEQQNAYINKSIESWRQTYKEQAEPWLTPLQYKENTHVG